MHRSINSWLRWLGGGTTRDLCHPLKANFVLPNSNLLKAFTVILAKPNADGSSYFWGDEGLAG